VATKVPLTSPLRHGVLAFLDALGFKGIWQRAEPTAVIDKFTHLLDQVRQANLYPVAADGLNVHLQAMSLSDTVVIACSSEADPAKFRESSQLVEEVASLIAVAHVTAGLLGGMVATRPPPLAYRGTVALGEYYLDPEVNLLLGPAIDEAAEHEKLAEGAFVWLLPSANALLTDRARSASSEKSLAGALIRRLTTHLPVVGDYPVPLKGGVPLRTSVINPLGARRLGSDGSVQLLFDPGRVRRGFGQAFAGSRVEVQRKAQVTTQFLDVAEGLLEQE